MRRLFIVAAFALSGLQVASPSAQNASSAQSSQSTGPVYTTRATAILVDVVVRDKKGALLTDLTQADFDVAEDGVRQNIGSFAVVNHGGGIGIGVKFRQPGGTTVLSPTDSADPNAAPAQPVEAAVTALVFDALSPEALSITQKAALGYVPMVGEAEARIAVFSTEPSLKVTQPYTNDLALIRKGIREVTATGTAAKEIKNDQKKELSAQLTLLDEQTLRVNAIAGSSTSLGDASHVNRSDRDAAEAGRRTEADARCVRDDSIAITAATRPPTR